MTRLATRLATAALAASSALVGLAGTAHAQGLARGVTTVALDAGTIGAVEGLGLTPAPVAPATLTASPLQAAFPIVGNLKGGVVRHVGGLSLTAGSTTLALTNYDIVLARGVLTAEATLNGTDLGRITLFDLGAAPAQPGCAATASLGLDQQAAGALTKVFGAPDLSGTGFGTACVAPRG